MSRSFDACDLNTRDDVGRTEAYLYGSAFRDRQLVHDPDCLRRYGHLTRKLLMHYARDHYNLHTVPVITERHFSQLVRTIVEYKVFNRLPGYDWHTLDHMFRKAVSDFFDVALDYDTTTIKRGFAPEFRAIHTTVSELPN